MTRYTLWKKTPSEAIILEDEGSFRTKWRCFKRARELQKKLIPGFEYSILVRRITIGKMDCDQWEFKPLEKED